MARLSPANELARGAKRARFSEAARAKTDDRSLFWKATHDWSLEEIEAIYTRPLLELIFRAQSVHRTYHQPDEVQGCTLLSIKTGGCPEDCAYCPQSAHYQTGLDRTGLLPVAEALEAAARARELEHVVFAGCTHRPAVELAEQLVAFLPSGLTRIFYSDNGSTAVEVALKLAYQYWQNRGEAERRTFITLHHAYHGDTVGAMSASEDSVFTRPFAPLLFRVVRAHAPYCYRCPLNLSRATCQIDCLSDLARLLRQEGGRVAGVLVEPMLQGAGGMIVWPAEFLAGVRRLCDEYGTLLIADEVLTGFGRTGRMFACEHASVKPDIICLSKALTAGYLSLGVTATTEEIYEAFLSNDRSKTFFHGHSYTANPLGCAVALASLELFRSDGVLDRVRALEQQLRKRLTSFKVFPHVGDVRVIGGVGIVELVEDKQTRAAGGYLDRVGPQLAAEFLRRGLLLRPLGNVIYFMPPYVITREATDWALDQMAEVLETWRWPVA